MGEGQPSTLLNPLFQTQSQPIIIINNNKDEVVAPKQQRSL